MKQLINKIIGSSEERTFEQILFIGICLFSCVFALFATIFNIIYNLYFSTILTSIILIYITVLYYFARFKNRYYFIGFYLFSTLSSLVCYFTGDGIYGATSYILLLILVLTLIYNPVKWHIKIFIFHITILCSIFLIEYLFPQLVVNPYETQEVLHVSLAIAVLLCALFGFVGLYFLRKSFDNEKEKNRQITNQKSMFFINLSHEIKTPLTLLENYLEKYIARKGEDEELIIMSQNIKKMRRDIVNYLNFENLERGKISFEKPDILLLGECIKEKIKLFIPFAEKKGITLNCTINPDIYINVNQHGIDQVLNNLLENAVKHSPEKGKITVTLTNEKNKAVLIIQNSGSEIPSDHLTHLFEPFYQLSREKLNAQGIGMGLYIVKKILDNTGGLIHVSSSKEKGVTFTVTLPLSSERKTTAQPVNNINEVNIESITSKAKDSAYLTNRKNIFLVEDNNDLLSYLASELNENYNVFVADNGLVALKKLENIPVPDLIISDIMMDTMDGYELLEKTLTDKKLSHIPFIFLTAKTGTEEKIASLNMGALDFISKPFSSEELKMKVKTIIEQKDRISEAVILDTKKQFTAEHFTKAGHINSDIFNTNALHYNLTKREKEIVAHIQQGLKYEEIGEKLHISINTVTRHVQNIYEKTGSSTKIDLLQKLFS